VCSDCGSIIKKNTCPACPEYREDIYEDEFQEMERECRPVNEPISRRPIKGFGADCMTVDDAVLIARQEGAFEPDFYGDVLLRIKSGGISSVDVKQTFVEAPK